MRYHEQVSLDAGMYSFKWTLSHYHTILVLYYGYYVVLFAHFASIRPVVTTKSTKYSVQFGFVLLNKKETYLLSLGLTLS